VIDSEAKGYITWGDLKNLCKRSLSIGAEAYTKSLHNNGLYNIEKKSYIHNPDGNTEYNSEKFEDEMSKTFFAIIYRYLFCGYDF